MSGVWMPAEMEIVEALTRCVGVMSDSQLMDAGWSGSAAGHQVRSFLNRLLEAGLLQRTIVNMHPRVLLDKPLVAWQPGADRPDLRGARATIRDRWHQPTQPTEVYWASRRAANLFGSTSRDLPDLFHRDHDLLLAEVYVFYRRHRNAWAKRWLGIGVIPPANFRTKNPDAIVFGNDGRPACVIESSGHCGLKQLKSFHEHCVCFELPYEIW